MSCLGVHFALTEEQEKKLLSLPPGDERIDYLQEDIEEAWDKEFLAESDKAWDGIHRTLTGYPNGESRFTEDMLQKSGPEELRLCIMGGRNLHDTPVGNADYIMRLVDADKVPAVALALAAITQDWFAENYRVRCKDVWPEYGEEDLEYSWDCFQNVRALFERAAKAGRSVLFTADQ